jgi:hypothetical protein
MAWCLVKHRDNFTFTFTFTKPKDTEHSSRSISTTHLKSQLCDYHCYFAFGRSAVRIWARVSVVLPLISSLPPSKCRYSMLKCTKTTSLHILPSSSFIITTNFPFDVTQTVQSIKCLQTHKGLRVSMQEPSLPRYHMQLYQF